MRIRTNNVQHRIKFNKKNKKCIYVWVAVDYNFKFKLHYYQISINQNEKITTKVYIEMLKRFDFVIDWLIRKNEFVLKKNRDFFHDTNKNNKTKLWKNCKSYKYYFNVSEFFDLFIIENCWKILHKYFVDSIVWKNENIIQKLNWI